MSEFKVGDELVMLDVRIADGLVQEAFHEHKIDFVSKKPEYEWPCYRVVERTKNEAIDAMIKRLEELR